jgi:hypothetical protein
MFTMRRGLVLVGAAALLALGARASADDFFNVTANGSGGTTVYDAGPNIIHLTDDLISESGSFSSLFGQNVTTSLSWGGVPNAVILTENATGTSATITFPSTGFTKTFTGSDPSDLQSQIHDFIKKDGEKAYAQFLEKMSQESLVSPLDGNPQASTAVIADAVFSRFGIINQQPTAYASSSGPFYLGLSGEGGVTRASGLNGNWANLNFDTGMRFGSNVAMSLGTTLDYRNTENSTAYTLAEEVGLPITLVNNNGNGVSWQITPWAFSGVSASYDQADGGLLVGGGGTSSFALHLNGLTVTVGDQISYTAKVRVTVDNYDFDTDINQWIVKNGAMAMYQIPGSPFFVEGGIVYTNFLRRAAVPDYWTPIGGAGVNFGGHSSLRVDFQGDYAHNYNNTGGVVMLVLAY